jgi:hypothetical protein
LVSESELERAAPGVFDPVRGKHRRVVDHAVAQDKDAEAAEIAQRDAGAAAADLLAAVGFQRVERVEFHAQR